MASGYSGRDFLIPVEPLLMRPYDRFCTPALLPDDPRETDALAAADRTTVPFEGDDLPVYRWGEGPSVLIAHGWGARAAYVAPYALALAAAGFEAVAPDAPAHTPSARLAPGTRQTTAVDFGRALCAVADAVGPLHGVVGHSFGGMAAAFALAGVTDGGPRLHADRLVMVSAPDRLATLLQIWIHATGAGAETAADIEEGVQQRFGFPVADFSVSAHAEGLPTRTLLIHDADDVEVPSSESERVDRALGGGHLTLTHGLGHRRTLRSPEVADRLVAFMRAP